MEVFSNIIELQKKKELEAIEEKLKELTEQLKELEKARKILTDEKEALLFQLQETKNKIFSYINNNNFLELASSFSSVNIKITNGQIKISYKLLPEHKEKLKKSTQNNSQ